MMIELPGVACCFDDLSPGDFFCFRRAQQEFGLCVSHDHFKSAIIFSYSQQYHSPIWLAVGGLPSDVLVRLPQAVLRSNLASVAFDVDLNASGVISADGEIYIRARVSLASSLTFNLRTGVNTSLKYDAKPISYSEWRIGLLIGDQFDPIFEFPSQPRQ